MIVSLGVSSLHLQLSLRSDHNYFESSDWRMLKSYAYIIQIADVLNNFCRPSWIVDGQRFATKIKSASDPEKVIWESNPSKACPKCQHVIDNNDVCFPASSMYLV